VNFNLSILIELLSFAIISQVLFIFAATCDVFHQGAAVKSNILVQFFISNTSTGIWLEIDCK
jgi:hypothetical protein